MYHHVMTKIRKAIWPMFSHAPGGTTNKISFRQGLQDHRDTLAPTPPTHTNQIQFQI